MNTRLRRLQAALGSGGEQHESMDVLLQLTLPIVLILAFVISTELYSLQRDLNTLTVVNTALQESNRDLEEEMQLLQQELAGTETGRLQQQLELAILSLQQQLLVQAVDELVRSERERLALAAYAALRPQVEQLLNAQIEPMFAERSRELAAMYNGVQAFVATQQRWQTIALEHFQQLVGKTFPEQAGTRLRRNQLKRIAPQNRAAFVARLHGELRAIEREASIVQLELMLAWISDRRSEEMVKAGSGAAWQAIQQQAGDANLPDRVQDFVDLKARALVGRMTQLAVPLLNESCRQAFNRTCEEVL